MRATNCGNVIGTILITGPGGLEHLCNGVLPGDYCEITHVFKTEPECPPEGEFAFQYDAILRTTACPETATDDGFAKFDCCTPRIEVEKTCPDSAKIGEEFLHEIHVRVPEGSCNVEVVVYDTICVTGLIFDGLAGVTIRNQPTPVAENGVQGQEFCFPFVIPIGTMSAGEETTITFPITIRGGCTGPEVTIDDHVEVKGTCGAAEVTDWDECLTTIPCKTECEPCVTLDASEENPQICAGDEAVVLLTATNCGTEKGRIVITGPGGFEYICESVDPGLTCETTHTIKTRERCPDSGEFLFNYIATLTIEGCDEKAEDPGFAKFFCCTPVIHVQKRCPEQVKNESTFSYGILVSIPEGACALEKVVVTDELCGDVLYANNANIQPDEAPPVGETGNVVWNLGPLGPGDQVAITFDVTAKADCPDDFCWNVVTVEGECGDAKVDDSDSCGTKIVCEADCEPCVTLDASEENPQICAGDEAVVILKATNCGTEKGRIVITGPGGFEYICESVDPGLTCETTHKFNTRETCPDNGEFLFEYQAVLTIEGCDEKAEDPGFAKFFCCKPEIVVEKRCPEIIKNESTFTYGIRVTIPEGACALEKVVVTDELCPEVLYADNANIPPSEAPPEGETGTLVWNLGPLGPGSEVVIRFDATVKVNCDPAGPAKSGLSCLNHVSVEGECGEAKVSDVDSCESAISCEENTACPRPLGFWRFQCLCAEDTIPNARGIEALFDCDEMSMIAECVDDQAQIFDWDGNDLDAFCRLVVIPKNVAGPGVPERVLAKRQFAALLANYCAGILPVTTSNGDRIDLPLDTPVNGCDYAIAIGGLIDGVDAKLVELEAGSENDTAYVTIRECLSDVNSGISIPYDPRKCFGGPTFDGILERLARENEASQPAEWEIETATGIDPAARSSELLKPVPNPFSRTTTMAYAIGGGSGERVEIAIYNTSGQRVRGLVSEFKGAGRYSVTWDGTNDSGAAVPAGVYFYRVAIGAQNNVSRVVLVK